MSRTVRALPSALAPLHLKSTEGIVAARYPNTKERAICKCSKERWVSAEDLIGAPASDAVSGTVASMTLL